MATTSCTWFFTKILHVGDRVFLGRGRYCSTVDVTTAMPSLRSSPTIRGDPHVGCACHMVQMSRAPPWRWRAGQGSPLAQPSPGIAQPLALPGEDGTGLDKRQGVVAPPPQPGKPLLEEALGRTKPRARDGLRIHSQLRLEHQHRELH